MTTAHRAILDYSPSHRLKHCYLLALLFGFFVRFTTFQKGIDDFNGVFMQVSKLLYMPHRGEVTAIARLADQNALTGLVWAAKLKMPVFGNTVCGE